jgi:transposase-like protein
MCEPQCAGKIVLRHDRRSNSSRRNLKEMKLTDAPGRWWLPGLKRRCKNHRFPHENWRCLRTNNPLERLLREVR